MQNTYKMLQLDLRIRSGDRDVLTQRMQAKKFEVYQNQTMSSLWRENCYGLCFGF